MHWNPKCLQLALPSSTKYQSDQLPGLGVLVEWISISVRADCTNSQMSELLDLQASQELIGEFVAVYRNRRIVLRVSARSLRLLRSSAPKSMRPISSITSSWRRVKANSLINWSQFLKVQLLMMSDSAEGYLGICELFILILERVRGDIAVAGMLGGWYIVTVGLLTSWM